MKLKENVHYYYDNDQEMLIIRYGAKQYSIVDSDKKYYQMMLNNSFKDDMKEFLHKNNLLDNLQGDIAHFNDRTFQYLRNRFKSSVTDLLPIESKFNELTFLIIGCGGVGTVVVDNIVRMGFKNFVLVDGDVIEQSNLNRQLFYTMDDIGKNKVEVLAKKIDKISSQTINVQQYVSKIESIEDLCDLNIPLNNLIMVNCADTPVDISNTIGEYSLMNNNIPFVRASVGIETGSFGPFFDSRNPYKLVDFSESKSLKGSIGSNNMITGALLSHFILDYIFKDLFPNNSKIYKEHIVYFDRFEVVDE